MNQYYALHDTEPKAAISITLDEAPAYQSKGYGIFHTVNTFKGRRLIENLVKINAWAIDMDGKGQTKEEMWKRIQSGLWPSAIVETRSGFHVYWMAKDAKPEHWNAIVLHRLVPFYGSDPRARDLARILRTPGFFHLKDPANPYLIKKIHDERGVIYTERQMSEFYPPVYAEEEVREQRDHTKRTEPQGNNFWDRVYSLDSEEALSRLSGTPHVGGEEYSFRRNGSGTKNIWVNGKSTSCWIDERGRIGSMDGGGPSVYQWLNWYHRNPSKTVAIIKEVFPECQIQKP